MSRRQRLKKYHRWLKKNPDRRPHGINALFKHPEWAYPMMRHYRRAFSSSAEILKKFAPGPSRYGTWDLSGMVFAVPVTFGVKENG